MSQRLVHAGLFAVLFMLLIGLASAGEPTPSMRPNIILIVADDLGYGELGCYGQTKIQTPHIDQLAAEGMRFTQFYAGSSVCAPSRSTIMTGLHTGHTPVRANGGGRPLLTEDVTLAEVLKEAGYATGGFGKWGLGVEGTTGHPNRQGFDQFFGYLHQIHAHFYYPYFLWNNNDRFPLPGNEGGKREQYAHDVIHRHALEFIRDHRDQPFFCYTPYTIPHVELVVPADSKEPYVGKWPEKPLPDGRKGYIGADDPYATFAGMVSRLDQHVGEIMQLLDELDLSRRTVVIFTSDNGGQGGHWRRMTDFFRGNGDLRGYKGEFYEGGIRVPMIVRWPGEVAPGSVSDHLGAFWDFMPTFAEIGRASLPNETDGVSLVPLLTGQGSARSHEYLYWEYPNPAGRSSAVRLGPWKLIRPKPNRPVEIYNIDKDLGETTNLVGQHPDIEEKLKQLLEDGRSPERSYPPDGPAPTIRDFVR